MGALAASQGSGDPSGVGWRLKHSGSKWDLACADPGFGLDQFHCDPDFSVACFLFLTHFRGKGLEQLNALGWQKGKCVQKQLPSLELVLVFPCVTCRQLEVSPGSWGPSDLLGARLHAVPVRHGVSEARLCCWEGKT